MNIAREWGWGVSADVLFVSCGAAATWVYGQEAEIAWIVPVLLVVLGAVCQLHAVNSKPKNKDWDLIISKVPSKQLEDLFESLPTEDLDDIKRKLTNASNAFDSARPALNSHLLQRLIDHDIPYPERLTEEMLRVKQAIEFVDALLQAQSARARRERRDQ